ncbi:MAG TPA: helix-turn-helix domain-containing protein [Chryseosolibacter sp.]
MVYQEYPIADPLRPYVKVIWSMESEETWAPPMRILPDSCVELVIHFNQPYKTTFSDNKAEVQPQSFVVAQMKNFIEIQPNGKIGMLSIRFSAQGAYHFFGMPMKEIANGIVDLKLVWNNLAKEIEERIIESRTTQQRVRRIQQYLLMQLSKNGKADVTVDHCLNLIYSAKGQVKVEDLATTTGMSNRQLVRKFNNSIGLSPKEFARIIKFIGSLNYLKQNQDTNLSAAANNCGYYDQAHFIHDFKEYSGLTPSQFLSLDNVFY